MLTEGQTNFLNNLDPALQNRIVRVEPWDSKGLGVANNLIHEIKQVLPDSEVVLTGSMFFKIAGERDIDITIYCPKHEQLACAPKLENIFGIHSKEGKSHIGWEFEKDGFHVTVYMSDLASPNTQAQKDLFELLKSRPDLVQEYERLKLSANGKTYREYQIAKYEFFNRVLGIR